MGYQYVFIYSGMVDNYKWVEIVVTLGNKKHTAIHMGDGAFDLV